jgi:hypothetical protein
MTYQEFIKQNVITMTAVRTSENPNMFWEKSSREYTMDHWELRLRFPTKGLPRYMTTYFSMGYGHNGKAPELAEVLECLAHDSHDCDQDFETWALGLGYETDSRKAERTYRICRKMRTQLKRFLGKAFETLLDCNDDQSEAA